MNDLCKEYVKLLNKLNDFVCNKFYMVDIGNSIEKGLLLDYIHGNIVLLTENGIVHIKQKDIYFMKPIKIPPLKHFSKEYAEILTEFQKIKEK